MKKLTGKDVALSGISAALAIVFVIGAIYISFATLPCYILGALAISLPLIKRNIISSLLSYIVASLVAFFVGNIRMLPFIMFYGLYAILQWVLDFYLYEKMDINKWIKIALDIVIKIGYFALVFWGLYALMNLTLADFSVLNIEWTMPLLILASFIAFVLYDLLYREVFKLIKRLLEKRV